MCVCLYFTLYLILIYIKMSIEGYYNWIIKY